MLILNALARGLGSIIDVHELALLTSSFPHAQAAAQYAVSLGLPIVVCNEGAENATAWGAIAAIGSESTVAARKIAHEFERLGIYHFRASSWVAGMKLNNCYLG